MIIIARTYPSPETLRSELVAQAKRNISAIAETRKPLSSEFKSHWGKADVRTQLWEMQNHKCCYCERKREKNRESDVEHFRPKADVTEADEEHRGYWWLAYEWENLLFCCRYCNQEYKQNHFPVTDECRRATTPAGSLEGEKALLINPTAMNPEDHIGFDWYKKPSENDSDENMLAFARGRSEYGDTTIKVAGLNGGDLPTERGELVRDLEAAAVLMTAAKLGVGDREEAKQRIREATSATLPFTSFRRDFFRKNGLAHYVAE